MKYVKIASVILFFSAIWVIAMIGGHPKYGWFPSSNFDLATESRLPEWFTLPQGLKRSDVNVELFYFVSPPFVQDNVKVLLIGPPPEKIILGKKIGIKTRHPTSTSDEYPIFNIIKVDGIEEVIEHKKAEPIYYVANGPAQKNR